MKGYRSRIKMYGVMVRRIAPADMILTLDAQARVLSLDISPALKQVFPLPTEHFLGKDIGTIYGAEYGQRALELVASVLSTRQSSHTEEWVSIGATRMWVLVAGLPIGPDQALLVVSDITARKRAEALLYGQNQILEKIARGDDLRETLEALILLLEAYGGGFLGSILLLDDEGKRLRTGAAPSLPDSYNQAVDGLEIGPQAGSCGTAAYLRQPVFTIDIEASPLWSDFCKLALASGLRACWSTPIFSSSDTVLGTFAMYYREPREPAPGDLELVHYALHLASIAIERDRKEQTIRASEKLKSAVLEAAHDCIILADADGKIVEFNPAAEQVFGYQRDQVIGQDILKLLVPSSKREEQLQALRHFQVFGPHRHLGHRSETTALGADGEEFPVELTLGAIEYNSRYIFVCYVRDLTDLKMTSKALEVSEARFQGAFDNASVGMALVDPHGKILKANQALASLLGFTKEELVDDNLLLRTHPDDLETSRRLFDYALAGSIQSYQIEKRYINKQGRAVWAVVDGSLIRNTDGEPLYFIVLVQDISKRKQADAELGAAMNSLSAANTELRRLNQAKSHFVSTVSHEFRSALAGIRAFSELMTYLDLDQDAVRRYAQDIYENTEHLSRMIDDLLDLERIESGRMTLHTSQVDLNGLLGEVVAMMGRRAPKHTFKLDLDPDLPPLQADPDKLIQVITNLLTNAVKYTPQGGDITVVSCEEKGNAYVQVIDQGIGIPNTALEIIFEPYVRIETDETRYIMGTGLGLPIAQQIVRLHGGNIWAESVEGKGSIFHFTLPIRS